VNKRQALGLSIVGALALLIVLLAVTVVQAKPDAASTAASAVQADIVSGTISYQGRLLDSEGHPVDGARAMTFRLYPQATEGTPLWSGMFPVPVEHGLFSVNLPVPPDLFDGQALWLGVQVEGEAEMVPRQQLTPVPYAFSLRPGAVINGNLAGGASSGVLQVINTSMDPQAPAVFGANFGGGPGGTFTSTGHVGVQGFSNDYGVAGYGTWGVGVRGDSKGGIGVLGTSTDDFGIWGTSTNSDGIVGDSAVGSGLHGRSITGTGVTAYSQYGAGIRARSDEGHALVTDGPSLIQGPNPRQIALLKWYPAIETPTSFTVGLAPSSTAFDGANMWVTNAGSRSVSVLRASDGAHVMTPTVGVGPVGIAYDGINMWVTNYSDNTVSVLRASDGAHVMTITVGIGPQGIAFDGANMWVVNRLSSSVSVLRASDGAHVMTPTVGGMPYAIAFGGANMWITDIIDESVQVLRADDGAHVMTIPVDPNPAGIAFDGANMWVSSEDFEGKVTVLRASDGAQVAVIPVGNSPSGIAFDGVNVWVVNKNDGTVSILRAGDFSLVKVVPVGTWPSAIAFDGANMWVANWNDGTVSKR
jgi:hypothetical protein